MLKRSPLFFCVLIFIGFTSRAMDVGPAFPVYTDDELLALFAENKQLQRVEKKDNCQLVQDIKARAIQISVPTYQFLYGDMLAWGACVERDVNNGIYYMQLAAQQGLAAALEQLGRYYANGILVQQDIERAIPYLREAASLGSIRARIELAQLLIDDYGSPLDYEQAYRWLYITVAANPTLHKQITALRAKLGEKMPSNIVARAKQSDSYW